MNVSIKTRKNRIQLLLSILFCTVFFATNSCRNNDDEKIEIPIPADKRYLSSVTDQDEKTVLTVEYYTDKKFKKFTFPEAVLDFRYVYDASGKISSCFVSTYESHYTYDPNGRIVSYQYDGQDYPVIYNAAENSYTFDYISGTMKIIFDAKGNCTKLLSGQDLVINFFYEENRHGSLTNGGDMNLTNFISVLPMFIYSQIPMNLLPIPSDGYVGSLGNQQVSSTYANEYDSENFLIKSTITTITNSDNGPITSVKTYSYHYTEL